MARLLLIVIPLILLIIYLVRKALQNVDLRAKLDEQDLLSERMKLANKLDPVKFKQQRSEIERIKKEVE